MQSEGVVIAIVSTIITAVIATTIVVAAVVAVVVATAVRAFGSHLLGHLTPNVEVIIIFRRPPTSSGYDRWSSHYPHNP
jgi:hypothetical protein